MPTNSLMRSMLVTVSALFLASCSNQNSVSNGSERQLDPITSKVLLQASSSWAGDQYVYPQGMPLITVKEIIFQPGAKSKPHTRDVPGAAVIQQGELLCEVPATGVSKRFARGDVLPITFKGDPHTCENISQKVSKALVFYAGAVDVPTVYYTH